MRIGVTKELHEGERRVATTPEVAALLNKLGFEVSVESGAGSEAKFTDAAYEAAGVTVVADVNKLYRDSDIILKVRAPGNSASSGINEIDLLEEGQTLISFIQPGQNEDLMEVAWRERYRPLPWIQFPGFPGHRRWTP